MKMIREMFVEQFYSFFYLLFWGLYFGASYFFCKNKIFLMGSYIL